MWQLRCRAKLVSNSIPLDPSLPLLPLQTLNEDTRISWKTGCSRSVTGTPAFFVNGLSVDADGFSFTQWTALLDPLFNASAAGPAARSKRLSGFAIPPL